MNHEDTKTKRVLFTAHLIPEVEDHLLELLRSLGSDEWRLPTIAPKWSVKDVVAHLLDTQLRKLTLVRDGAAMGPAPAFASHADFVAFIDDLNSKGVAWYGRLSTPVLISLMETASRESAAFHQALDPMAPAVFGVSWAGEDRSLNWFDTARELTERWHHQQQIRLATGRPGIMTPELYHPVLDCFMRALPFVYRHQQGGEGTHVRVDVTGDCGGSWFLAREGGAWRLTEAAVGAEAAAIAIPQDIAWRIFTKGIARDDALAQVTLSGDRGLAAHVLQTVAIIG